MIIPFPAPKSQYDNPAWLDPKWKGLFNMGFVGGCLVFIGGVVGIVVFGGLMIGGYELMQLIAPR